MLGKLSLWLNRVTDIIERILLIIATVLMVGMVLVICVAVLARFFFNYPAAWSVQISGIILLDVTFLITPWLVRKDEHIKLDLLTNSLSAKYKYYFRIFATMISIIVCALLAYFGTVVTWDTYVRGVMLFDIIDMPKYICLVVIPFSGLVMLLELLNQLLQMTQKPTNIDKNTT